jgi:hypothetical protein
VSVSEFLQGRQGHLNCHFYLHSITRLRSFNLHVIDAHPGLPDGLKANGDMHLIVSPRRRWLLRSMTRYKYVSPGVFDDLQFRLILTT